MTTSKKLVSNVVISSIAKILSTVSALVALGFITRHLSKDDWGSYVIALSYFALFSALGDWGLYQTATREFSRPKANEKEIMSHTAGLRIVITLSLFALLPPLIFFLPYSNQLKIALLLGLFAYTFFSFYQILIGLFQKRLIMYQVTLIEMLGKMVQAAIIVIGVKANWQFLAIFSTLLINMVFNFALVFFFSRKFIAFKPRFDKQKMFSFLKKSWPIGLSVLITFIYFKADTILLSLLRSEKEVSIYGAAYKIIENLNFFPGLVVGLVTPMIAYNIFSNRKKFISIVNKNFTVFLVLVVPLAVGTIFLAEDIVHIIAGETFTTSVLILKIVIFSLVFIFFGQLFNAILISAKLQKQLLKALIFVAIFNVSMNLIFIPKFSYLATATISVATELLVAIIGFWLIKKHLRFVPRAKKVFFIFTAGALMAFYMFLIGKANLPFNFALGPITGNFIFILLTSPLVYFMGIIGFKVITKKEILEIVKK